MTKLLTYITIITIFTIPATAIQHELSWDDGTSAGYYWGPGHYDATTFTAPYDLEIVKTKVYWYNCTGQNKTADFDMYDDNGGIPGNPLFAAPITDTVPYNPGG